LGVGSNACGARPLARLLDSPSPAHAYDRYRGTNIDATLEAARATWIAPDELEGSIERWLPFAEREPMAVDAVVELAKCGGVAWQASRGLELVERTIADGYGEVAGRTWHLTDWLKEVRHLALDTPAMTRWRRIVDGLAGAGDRRAARLQAAEE
jgi:hypothetical protein